MVNSADPQRGNTLIECAVAIALLTALAIGFGNRASANTRDVRWQYERTLAENALSAAYEADLAAGVDANASGETVLQPGTPLHAQLASPELVRTGKLLEPGLWQLRYELTWRPAGTTARATSAARARVVRSYRIAEEGSR